MAEAASPHCEPHYTGPASWQSAVEARRPCVRRNRDHMAPQSRVNLFPQRQKDHLAPLGPRRITRTPKGLLSEREVRALSRVRIALLQSRCGRASHRLGSCAEGCCVLGWCHLRIKHIVFGAALPRGLASGSAHAGAGTSQDGAAEWLGLAAGPPAAAETLLAADLADLFATARPLRVLTLLGDARRPQYRPPDGHEPRSEGGAVQEIHRMAAELGEPTRIFAQRGNRRSDQSVHVS
jgi:hypothetical protein